MCVHALKIVIMEVLRRICWHFHISNIWRRCDSRFYAYGSTKFRNKTGAFNFRGEYFYVYGIPDFIGGILGALLWNHALKPYIKFVKKYKIIFKLLAN